MFCDESEGKCEGGSRIKGVGSAKRCKKMRETLST